MHRASERSADADDRSLVPAFPPLLALVPYSLSLNKTSFVRSTYKTPLWYIMPSFMPPFVGFFRSLPTHTTPTKWSLS